MSRCQLTRVAPSSADHPHAAEPYPPDERKGNRPCAVVVSVVRLESKVERHCVLREGKYAATWTRQDGSVYGGGAYWRISTGRSPQPALSFPAAALASPACGFQRRPSCGGEWDAGVRAGGGDGVALGTGQSRGRSGAGLGEGTAMADVGWGARKSGSRR